MQRTSRSTSLHLPAPPPPRYSTWASLHSSPWAATPAECLAAARARAARVPGYVLAFLASGLLVLLVMVPVLDLLILVVVLLILVLVLVVLMVLMLVFELKRRLPVPPGGGDHPRVAGGARRALQGRLHDARLPQLQDAHLRRVRH